MNISPTAKVRLCKIYTANNDLTKRWFVYYYYLKPNGKEFQRFCVYGNINTKETIETRILEAKKLVQLYNRKLKSGWNPFEKKAELLYFDNTEYQRKQKQKVVTFDIAYYLNLAYTAKAESLRQKSQEKYKAHIRIFTQWLAEKKLNHTCITDFKTEQALEFINYLSTERNLSTTTRNTYLQCLRGLFKKALHHFNIDKTPFDIIEKSKEIRHGYLPFNEAQRNELKSLFEREHPQLWLFCMMQYYCFIRPGELRKITVGAIDFDTQTITIDGEISKNKKTQTVVIPTQLFAMLQRLKIVQHPANHFLFSKGLLPGAKMYSANYFCQLHNGIIRKLGYGKRHTLYSWKHTGVKKVALSKIPIKELQMQLRHHDLNTLDIYIQSLGVVDLTNIKNSFPAI